eukprot:1428141-Prymnesium_polylepis.1
MVSPPARHVLTRVRLPHTAPTNRGARAREATDPDAWHEAPCANPCTNTKSKPPRHHHRTPSGTPLARRRPRVRSKAWTPQRAVCAA